MEKPVGAITIKDVALKAGVSTATVSHVINKTRFVSPELSERVHSAINELGYYPNLIIGSLRKKKTYTIGLVIPSIANETFGRLAETIQRILFQAGYNLIICNVSNDSDIEYEAYNMLIMKKVDAIISTPTAGGVDKLKEITERGIPLILVDREMQGINADTVRLDYYKGSYEVVEHLSSLGHLEIGYIDRKIDQSHSIEQRKGFIEALEKHNLVVRPENIIRANGFDYKAGMEAARQLIKNNSNITAIFAYYDILALGCMRGIQDMGYQVPNDISIVGCDEMPFTDFVSPRLTTLTFPTQKISQTVCDILMKHLATSEDTRIKVSNVVILPKLVVRESTTRKKS